MGAGLTPTRPCRQASYWVVTAVDAPLVNMPAREPPVAHPYGMGVDLQHPLEDTNEWPRQLHVGNSLSQVS